MLFILMFLEFNRPTQSACREEEMFCTALLWLECFNKGVVPSLLSLIFLSVTRIDHNFSLLKYPTKRSATGLWQDHPAVLCCTSTALHLWMELELLEFTACAPSVPLCPSPLLFSETHWMQLSTLTQKTKECINICLHITFLSYWIVCKSLTHFQKPLIQIMSNELCYGEQVRFLFLFDKSAELHF